MAVISHKRKSPRDTEAEEQQEAARAIFQRHFEAQFEPLPQPVHPVKDALGDHDGGDSNSDDGPDEDDEEWAGISDEEEEAVEVVDHTPTSARDTASMGKRELKAFMSSRPPTHESLMKKPVSSTPSTDLPEDSRTLLSQDLELHRLISESHLLDPSSKLHSKPFADGRIRMHATDLRITSLAPGSASILQQKKMPMAMRKGIESTKKQREDQRRREAAENGIVLERKGGDSRVGGVKDRKRKREGARVDLPGIGRMRGAELTLSESDIRSMESASSFRGSSRKGSSAPRGRKRR